MQIPFQLEVKHKSILGILHIPANRAPGSPLVLMSYGLNGNRVDNNRITTIFGRRAEESGIIFCRFDYRGLGVSEVDFWEIDMDTKVFDSLAVLDFLKGCLQGETYRLFIMGFSDGCRIAASLLKYNLEIFGSVWWSPIFFIEKQLVDSSIPRKFQREPRSKKLMFPFKGLWVNQTHLRQQVMMRSEFVDLCNFSGAKLTVFGGNDQATIATFRQINHGEREIPNATNIVIPEADHLFSGSQWTQELIRKTTEWILAASQR